MVPCLKNVNNICKGKNLIRCLEKKEHTNPINAAGSQYMVSAAACRMLMAARYWQAAGERDVISLQFLTNTVQRNKIP